jgi:hypothetical protein
MKKKSYILILILSMVLASCAKEEINNGYIEIKATSHGVAAAQAQIYLRRGADTSTISVTDTFDRKTTTDGDGLAYFRDLAPDTYTILGRNYCQVDQKYTSAWAIVIVKNKIRSNGYDVTIDME